MKWIYLCIVLLFQNSFAQELIELDSFPLEASSFKGVDSYGNSYWTENAVLHKKGGNQSFIYSDFSLGPIESVDLINPLKVVVFYQQTNTVVFLDNRLNEIERLALMEIPELANIEAATNAGNNRLWLFNGVTQQLELFNFRTTQSKTVSQPFSGNFKAMASNFNYCYVLTDTMLRTFNQYGSILSEVAVEGIETVYMLDDSCVGFKNNELLFLEESAFNPVKLPPSENPIKDLHLRQDFLYIYDGKLVRTFSLTQPKK